MEDGMDNNITNHTTKEERKTAKAAIAQIADELRSVFSNFTLIERDTLFEALAYLEEFGQFPSHFKTDNVCGEQIT